jgi:hypothetical protein
MGSPQHEQYRCETWLGSVHRAQTIMIVVIVVGSLDIASPDLPMEIAGPEARDFPMRCAGFRVCEEIGSKIPNSRFKDRKPWRHRRLQYH